MDLSIIILSFNTKKLLRACLASVLKNTRGFKFELIVVDNGSTDGSATMVEKDFPQVILLKNKTNLGFAKANNQGMKKAKGKYLLLLNSDTSIKENSFKKLLDFVRTKPQLAVVGPRLLNQDGSPQPSVGPFFTLPELFLWLFSGDRLLFVSPARPRLVDWVMGSAFLVKKAVFEETKGFDKSFFMYLEEVEWCYRIRQAGGEVWFYPQAEVFHLVRGSSPEGRGGAVVKIYQSLIYLYQKHFAPWQLAVLKLLLKLKAGLAWLVGILTGNKDLKATYEKAFKVACHV